MNETLFYFKLMYGGYAEKWKNENDDRKLFVAIYHQIIKSLEIAISLNDTYIKVALHREIEKDEDRLNEIINEFEFF